MKWKNKNIKFTYEQAMSYGFMAILSTVFIFSFHGSKVFSEVENRNLQSFPEFNVEKLVDQQFQKEFQNYRNDQFILRDTWIHLKTKMELMMGKKELNGVYLGKDEQLFEEFLPTQDNTILQESMNAFAKQYKKQKVSLMLVPNPIEILQNQLPNGVITKSQSKYLLELKEGLDEKIQWIDMVEPLMNHNSEYIYYRSDHHWTTLGAYYGFEQFAQAKKLKINVEDWTPTLVSNSFYGTLSGKSGYMALTPDDIYTYLPIQDALRYVVKYIDSQEKSTSVYKSENLSKKDQYSVFLNGNHPIIEIDTTSKYDKRLLILKDSYANSMVPFLLPYYSKIVVIDPRYYNEELLNVIEDNKITDILLLYNVNTFYQDTSLTDLMHE